MYMVVVKDKEEVVEEVVDKVKEEVEEDKQPF
jgi:hypothetical protein